MSIGVLLRITNAYGADPASPSLKILPRILPKHSVCSISIHSDTEMQAFKRLLPNRDFEFHDLTTREQLSSGSSPVRKIKEACEQQIKCDVLSISGHFGGEFFGETGTRKFGTLSLDDLQELMCEPKCQNLFKNLKEVFFFSCNTLAGKKRDERTPQEYLRVLLAHHTPPTEAVRAVEARYGYGPSYQDQIRRMFSKVPMIYGFDARSPAASTIERFLEGYLKDIPDYSEHLESLRTPGFLAVIQAELDRLNHRPQWKIPSNKPIATAFQGTHFTQCAGQDAESPNPWKGVASEVCYLVSHDVSVEDKLKRVQTLVESRDFLLHLPAIETFFRKNPPHKYATPALQELYAKIGQTPSARKRLKAFLKDMNRGLFKMELLRFGSEVGWIEKAAYDKEFHLVGKPVEKAYQEILKRPADPGGLDSAIKQLLTGQLTIREIRKSLEESDENRRNQLYALHEKIEGFPPSEETFQKELLEMKKGKTLRQIRKKLLEKKRP
ncbi:hypothetical protein WDW86_19070 [Bdellovibrionota bacterium FG-2]